MTDAGETLMDSGEATTGTAEPEQSLEYAIVEVFGHRRLAGRIVEVERFGAKLLRIDVPDGGDFATGFKTQFYGGAALFSITPTEEATERRMNKPYEAPGRSSLPSPEDGEDGDAAVDDDELQF